MGMNSKDQQVHAMARQLAARRGTTVTEAVLPRFRRLRWPDQRSSEELQAELYDEHGLPI